LPGPAHARGPRAKRLDGLAAAESGKHPPDGPAMGLGASVPALAGRRPGLGPPQPLPVAPQAGGGTDRPGEYTGAPAPAPVDHHPDPERNLQGAPAQPCAMAAGPPGPPGRNTG